MGTPHRAHSVHTSSDYCVYPGGPVKPTCLVWAAFVAAAGGSRARYELPCVVQRWAHSSGVRSSRRDYAVRATVRGVRSPCNLTFSAAGWQKIVAQIRGVFRKIITHPPLEGGFWPKITFSHPFFVFTPSPKFAVTGPSATFCGPSIYSLRSIHWYPSQLQYAKGCQITRGRPSGGRP